MGQALSRAGESWRDSGQAFWTIGYGQNTVASVDQDRLRKLPPTYVRQQSTRMKLLDALFRKSPWKGWKPLPRKRCPVCKGEILFRKTGGARPEGGRWDGMETICPTCGKSTVDDPFMPDNDNPAQHVAPNTKGWVTCPSCGFRFMPSDRGAFRDGHHTRCGQALVIDG